MILSAQEIRKLCVYLRPEEGYTNYAPRENPLIEPYTERGVAYGRTYGLSSCGYDIRIAEDIWLWPFWGRLASTIEHFNIPSDLCMEIKDKSSNARKFILVQNTVGEPGWSGYLTLELTRFLPWPIKIKRGTPIAQVMFKKLDKPTEQPYRGKYNNQARGPQPAILSDKL